MPRVLCRRAASTSEDVTMATWGGSTAGNLESIDEDDDDDDDDDDNQCVTANQNGEFAWCVKEPLRLQFAVCVYI